jgi:hypothetical protein
MSYKHGHYFLSGEKGFYLFNSWLKKGRAIFNDGRAIDLTYESHPKIVKAILEKGEIITNPFGDFRKSLLKQKD